MQVADKTTRMQIKGRTVCLSMALGALLGVTAFIPTSLAWATNASQPPLSMATAILTPEEAGEPGNPFVEPPPQPALTPPQLNSHVSAAVTTPPVTLSPSVSSPAQPLSMATATLTPEEAGEPPLSFADRVPTPETTVEAKSAASTKEAAPPPPAASPQAPQPMEPTQVAENSWLDDATSWLPSLTQTNTPSQPPAALEKTTTPVIEATVTKPPALDEKPVPVKTASSEVTAQTTAPAPVKVATNTKDPRPEEKPPHLEATLSEVAAKTPSSNTDLQAQTMPFTEASTTNPETAKAWAMQLQALEQENQALRQKVGMNETDRLSDIKIDAVSQIHEDVLRARIAELENQMNKMNMKNDNGDLPEKTINPLSSTQKKTAPN